MGQGLGLNIGELYYRSESGKMWNLKKRTKGDEMGAFSAKEGKGGNEEDRP